MKVVVVGAGVVGASVAFRLAEAGAAVTVLETGRVGGGTSGCSFAWTNSHNGFCPIEYHALRIASQARWRTLQERFGARWFHPSGNLEWAKREDAAGLLENVRRLQERGYRAELISPGRMLELEPWVDPAVVGDAAIAWFADDGWVDPVEYAGDMILAAVGLGAVLQTGARVAGMEMRGGRVAGVRLADGTRIDADMVVNCAGRWAKDATDEPGLQVPLAPTVGVLVFTPPVACGVRRVLHSPGVNMRADGAGRVMAHAEDLESSVGADAAVAPGMEVAVEVLRRAAEVVPGLRGVQAEAVRKAVRPIPQDGLPAVGRMKRVEGYYLAVTHSGVTLSPILGELVADEIVAGVERAELAPFRPARFFN